MDYDLVLPFQQILVCRGCFEHIWSSVVHRSFITPIFFYNIHSARGYQAMVIYSKLEESIVHSTFQNTFPKQSKEKVNPTVKIASWNDHRIIFRQIAFPNPIRYIAGTLKVYFSFQRKSIYLDVEKNILNVLSNQFCYKSRTSVQLVKQ